MERIRVQLPVRPLSSRWTMRSPKGYLVSRQGWEEVEVPVGLAVSPFCGVNWRTWRESPYIRASGPGGARFLCHSDRVVKELRFANKSGA